MAKRKKRITAKAPKKYVALWSECEGVSQLSPISASNGDYAFDTPAKAQAAVKESLDDGELMHGSFAIAEVIMVGKASGVEWTANVNLRD